MARYDRSEAEWRLVEPLAAGWAQAGAGRRPGRRRRPWLRQRCRPCALPTARIRRSHPQHLAPQGPPLGRPRPLPPAQHSRTYFCKLKQLRRVATRFDKLARNFLAAAMLASTRNWLRAVETTP